MHRRLFILLVASGGTLVEPFVPRAISNPTWKQQAPEETPPSESPLPTELDEHSMLTMWDPETRTQETPNSALFSSHEVLSFGDGGGIESGVHGAAGQEYKYGGGYTIHLLQVDDSFAHTMNNAFVSAATNIRAVDPSGITLSNQGGWHSSGNLLDYTCVQGGGGKLLCGQAVESLRNVLEAACDMAFPGLSTRPSRAWVNVNRVGNFNEWHHHGSGFSGVYYVNIPKISPDALPSSGCLAMRTAGAPSSAGSFSLVRPINGMMVIFPSTLLHSVIPFFQAPGAKIEERISVAFNF